MYRAQELSRIGKGMNTARRWSEMERVKETMDSILSRVQQKPKKQRPAQEQTNLPRRNCEFCMTRMKMIAYGENSKNFRRMWKCDCCGAQMQEKGWPGKEVAWKD